MHFYSFRNSFLSDCSFFFTLSFSYNSSAVKKYCNKIHNCMNHLTNLATFLKLLISFFMSNYSVYRFHKIAQYSANLLQCTITCSAVFLIWSHEQIEDKKSETWILFKKAVSLMQLMWICVIIELSVFCSCVWSLTVLWLRNSTSRKCHFRSLLI